MLTKLTLVLVVLAQASAGWAVGEFMLCFHGDGTVEVERFNFLCCEDDVPTGRGGAEQTPCQDDSCQDVPLSISAAQSIQTPPAIERSSEVPLPIGTVLTTFPQVQIPEAESSPKAADPPPRSSPREHLRTIILRI